VASLTIGEAAALLHTTPSTIRSWEQRLGYPVPRRSSSGQRRYDATEVSLLGDALRRGLTISSAIREIREQTGSHDELMRESLASLDADASDVVLEASIALRGVSRAFDESVLPALDGLRARRCDPAVLALAVEWAMDRACWCRRQAAAPTAGHVVIVDASPECSMTSLASRILQLQLALRSVRSHMLRGAAIDCHESIVRRLRADAVVLVGDPPPSACARGPAHRAAFRAEGAIMPADIETLPSQPRLAAERLVARVT
jgi:DNA-binding transcriptional MerR regulator